MFLNKLKSVLAVLLVIVCIGGGAGTLVSHAVLAGGPAQDPGQAPIADRAPEEKPYFRLGDMVDARFFFRNAGENPINISYPRRITPSYYKALHFTENKGEEIQVRQSQLVPVPVGWLACRLAPGEHAEVYGELLAIDHVAAKQSTETVLSVEPGNTYCVRYTLPNYGDSKAGNLQTGKFRFTVIDKGATRQKRPTAAELQKYIAWGTPGKNGLQAGVLLVPVKEGNPDDRPAPAEEAAEEEKQALQGGWEGQSGERDGKAIPDEEIKKLRVSIKGDRMLMIPRAEWTPLRFKLDAVRSPKLLRVTAIEGPDKDKTLPVIYRLDKEADTLTLCFDEKNGKAVPEDFAPRKGSGLVLLVLKHELRPPTAPAARK